MRKRPETNCGDENARKMTKVEVEIEVENRGPETSQMLGINYDPDCRSKKPLPPDL